MMLIDRSSLARIRRKGGKYARRYGLLVLFHLLHQDSLLSAFPVLQVLHSIRLRSGYYSQLGIRTSDSSFRFKAFQSFKVFLSVLCHKFGGPTLLANGGQYSTLQRTAKEASFPKKQSFSIKIWADFLSSLSLSPDWNRSDLRSITLHLMRLEKRVVKHNWISCDCDR